MVRGVRHLGVAAACPSTNGDSNLRCNLLPLTVPERKEHRRSADPGALLPLDRLSVGGRVVHVRGTPRGFVLEQAVRVGLISGVGGTALHSQGGMAVCRRGVCIPTTGRRPQRLLAADGASRLECWPRSRTSAQPKTCPAQFRNPSSALVSMVGQVLCGRLEAKS